MLLSSVMMFSDPTLSFNMQVKDTVSMKSECEDCGDLPFIYSLPFHSPSLPERCQLGSLLFLRNV